MMKNNLQNDNQYGYKKGHSTETILLKISNDILIASDKKTATVLLLLDLSAAFDTVDIDRLLKILFNEIGIRGTALNWFTSFLRHRTMRVKVKGSFSDVLSWNLVSPKAQSWGHYSLISTSDPSISIFNQPDSPSRVLLMTTNCMSHSVLSFNMHVLVIELDL